MLLNGNSVKQNNYAADKLFSFWPGPVHPGINRAWPVRTKIASGGKEAPANWPGLNALL